MISDGTVRSLTAAVLVGVPFSIAACATENVQIEPGEYEGREQIVVRTPTATWSFDVAAGGFSKLIDRDGRDWIAFSKDPLKEFPASAAAGYRGIPNTVFGGENPDAGAGHPGFDQCVSELIPPDTIRTESESGRYAWTWSFSGDTARMKMLKADSKHPWWFLYEGPIAGQWSPRTHYWGSDQGGPRTDTPDGASQYFDQLRWVYFGDASSPRILFLAQVEPDTLPDTVWFLGSEDGGSTESSDGMVVFGFGRGLETTPQFRGAGHEFILGFIEEKVTDDIAHARVAAKIEERLGQ